MTLAFQVADALSLPGRRSPSYKECKAA